MNEGRDRRRLCVSVSRSDRRKPNDVDTAIDAAIKTQQAKAGLLDAVDNFPNVRRVSQNSAGRRMNSTP